MEGKQRLRRSRRRRNKRWRREFHTPQEEKLFHYRELTFPLIYLGTSTCDDTRECSHAIYATTHIFSILPIGITLDSQTLTRQRLATVPTFQNCLGREHGAFDFEHVFLEHEMPLPLGDQIGFHRASHRSEVVETADAAVDGK